MCPPFRDEVFKMRDTNFLLSRICGGINVLWKFGYASYATGMFYKCVPINVDEYESIISCHS